MFLVQGRRKMAVFPAVTALILNHIVMDTWTEHGVVSTGWYGIGVSFCYYCSTVISQCFGYID